ncbi:MAG TPA: diadenylate cyclase [Dissulfurispiraceae bacterium]|nr:diadenylate cyclase [Dissulfurispiraceae bacterium]
MIEMADKDQKAVLLESALRIADATDGEKVFLFLSVKEDVEWFGQAVIDGCDRVVLVVPKQLTIRDATFGSRCSGIIRNWSGNQSRFSRIKYAFLHAVMAGIIQPSSKVVCVLGPHGKSHLDTITIHDLRHSWSEEFPFEVEALFNNKAFHTIMAVVDIALDIGALGREGKSVGTIFLIGDALRVMESSRQVVFNPFRGYPKKDRLITLPQVVESLKELAKLDGAIIIASDGTVEAAGRHLETAPVSEKKFGGLGARHRSAAGITRKTESVAVVVSESTGKVTIFERGRILATLEPVISRRMV